MPDGRIQVTFDDERFLQDFPDAQQSLAIYIQQRGNQIVEIGLEGQDLIDLTTSEKALQNLGIDPNALYDALG